MNSRAVQGSLLVRVKLNCPGGENCSCHTSGLVPARAQLQYMASRGPTQRQKSLAAPWLHGKKCGLASALGCHSAAVVRQNVKHRVPFDSSAKHGRAGKLVHHQHKMGRAVSGTVWTHH